MKYWTRVTRDLAMSEVELYLSNCLIPMNEVYVQKSDDNKVFFVRTIDDAYIEKYGGISDIARKNYRTHILSCHEKVLEKKWDEGLEKYEKWVDKYWSWLNKSQKKEKV